MRLASLHEKLAGLGPTSWWVLVKGAVLMHLFAVGVRFGGFAWLHRRVDVATPRHAGAVVDPQRLAGLLASFARRGPLPIRCLAVALAQCLVLRWCGGDARLCVGIRLEGSDRLDAHAWVEIDGEPVGERADIATEFKPIADWDGRGVLTR